MPAITRRQQLAEQHRSTGKEWAVYGTRGGGQSGKVYVTAPNEEAAKAEARRRWGRGRGIKITKVVRV